MSTVRPTVLAQLEPLGAHGERPAVVAFTDAGPCPWSYAALDAAAARGAGALARRGVGAGDRVVLFARPSPEWIAAALGIMRIGGVIVPLDLQLGRDTLAHVLEDCAPRVLLADADGARRLEDAGDPGGVATAVLDEFTAGQADGAGPPEPADVGPDATAVLFYTSGTTGPPKGVPLTHSNLAFEIAALADSGLVSSGDRVLLPLPLHHVYPFVVGLLSPLALGLPVLLPAALTGPELLRAIREGHATVIIGVPRLYRALLAGLDRNLAARGRMIGAAGRGLWRLAEILDARFELRAGARLLAPLRRRLSPELRLLASGGAALDPAIGRRLQALGLEVGIGYGLTETAPLITLNPPGSGRLDSVGRALDGVEIRFDPSAEPGRGTNDPRRGELLVRGPNVFAGYHNLPERSREAFTDDGWFRTGDLASQDAGGWIRIHGRVSTMIVTEGGENLDPEALEDAYAEAPEIAEIGVLQLDGRLVGVAVPEPQGAANGDTDPGAALRAAVDRRARRLPSYQRLDELAITREALPRTRLGKLQRHRLAERFERARAGDEAPPGPVEPHEMSGDDRALLDHPAARETWSILVEQFPERRLAPDSRPQLDLGVDSLKWLDLTLEIQRRTGVELDEAAIADIETVRDLLAAAARRGEGAAGGRGPGPLEAPERFLNADQRRRLESEPAWRRTLTRAGFALNRALFRTAFALRAEGLEHVPADGPCVLMPNHQSYLDAPAIAAVLDPGLLERIFWAGWTGIMYSNPALRVISRLVRLVPIDPERGALSGLAFAAAALDRGHPLVWFPEGQRSPDGRLQPFRPGIGRLLADRPVTVVPVLVRGTRRALPPGRRLPRRAAISLVFAPPVDVARLGAGDDPDALAAALRERLAALAAAD